MMRLRRQKVGFGPTTGMFLILLGGCPIKEDKPPTVDASIIDANSSDANSTDVNNIDARMSDANNNDGDSGGIDAEDAGMTSPCHGEFGNDHVCTSEGWIRGSVSASTTAFLGIPFAAPPLDALRWRPPEPPALRNDVLDTTAFSSVCVQRGDTGVEGNEDCLSLNVWKPNDAAPGALKPVMVYIHGGHNEQGSASIFRFGVQLYNGERLATAGDVVVVTIQYRVGALGFLAHPELSNESAQLSGIRISGNYGILDQIAALRWLKNNIEAFGGDPERLLLFGESAGGRNTCVLLTSPLTHGLFGRVLMQSAGACKHRTLPEKEIEGERYAAAALCTGQDSLTCLRELSLEELLAAADSFVTSSDRFFVAENFAAVVDNYVLLDSPDLVLARGQQQAVPVLLGANADEMTTLFGASIPADLGVPAYRQQVKNALGDTLGDAALALYPASDFDTPKEALIAVASDAEYICPSRRIAWLAARAGTMPVYRYFFTHHLDSPLFQVLGAGHGIELPFVFQHLGHMPDYTANADDLSLQASVLNYWTHFADTGSPGVAAEVEWPAYIPETDNYLELATPLSLGSGLLSAKCDFWDAASVDE